MPNLPLWYLGTMAADECDRAAAEFAALPSKQGTIGFRVPQQLDPHYRDSTVRFAERLHWFGLKLYGYGLTANTSCGWDYDIDDYEDTQYAEYTVGQHYNWHVDTPPLSSNTRDRKITVVCLMNEPSAFEGGQLQMRFYQELTPPLGKGTVIAFPSIVEHRVTPVTAGVRYSATMWLSGPRFR